MVRKRRTLFLWLVLPAFLLGGAGLLWYVRTRSGPPLMQRALKAADVADWRWINCTFLWLSDHEVLFCRIPSLPKNVLQSGPVKPFKLFRLDVATGEEQILTALTKQMNQAYGEVHILAVSPNGRWLLWETRGTDEGDAFISTLDGTHSIPWKSKADWPSSGFRGWTSDSQHWAEFGMDWDDYKVNEELYTSALIYSLDQPGKTKRLRFDPASRVHYQCAASFAPPNRLLVANPPVHSDKPLTATEIEIVDSTLADVIAPSHRYKVPVPPGAEVRDIVFSPEGDRVAWMLRFPNQHIWPEFLCRLIPALKASPKVSHAIWVSRIDGSQMHEVGHMEVPTAQANAYFELKWVPGGKRLSFIYQDTLYTVPAD
jgi:hypothetical protein